MSGLRTDIALLYVRITFFALVAIGSVSLKALKEIRRAYCLFVVT